MEPRVALNALTQGGTPAAGQEGAQLERLLPRSALDPTMCSSFPSLTTCVKLRPATEFQSKAQPVLGVLLQLARNKASKTRCMGSERWQELLTE